ncbi:putative signal transduction protein [Moritella sp. JT01]|uniref:HDOD domain-containing protein n=1 Tax=Moritella sp. JT01 TaxID=756698 RepID=UPI000797FFF1|nr:HDOD domain-containing protein [Moritella sp. JT01]KXO08148.1 putative signal transduction protein [Moritella sp. JT01]
MNVEYLFSKLKQPPVIPQLLQEMMNSFNHTNISLDKIARRIAMDPVITAKVLKMANSAAYSRGQHVESIEQAAIKLGLNKLRSLVIASSLANNFKRENNFDICEFWRNSFQVAQIAKAIASQTHLDPEIVFTCSLMHNIGELLIQSALPEEASLIALSQAQGQSRIEAQHAILSFDFTDVGLELARQWNFTDTFANAIHQQLDPLSCEKISNEAVLIRLAVFVNFAMNAGVPAPMIIHRFPQALAQHLNIDPEVLLTLLQAVQQQGNELTELLMQDVV